MMVNICNNISCILLSDLMCQHTIIFCLNMHANTTHGIFMYLMQINQQIGWYFSGEESGHNNILQKNYKPRKKTQLSNQLPPVRHI